MVIGAGEALLLAGLVALLYWLLRPLRVWLERRLTRLLGRAPARRGRLVVLERRDDGSFGREDRHGR